MNIRHLFFILFLALVVVPSPSHADLAPADRKAGALDMEERLELARQFVLRVGGSLKEADKQMKKASTTGSGVVLPDGEYLSLRLKLDRNLTVSIPVTAFTDQGQILLSLLDFTGSLDFPIDVDPEQGTAQGWYIRETKPFTMDIKTGAVQTENGTFTISDRVKQEDGDIFVPVQELEQWFGFGLKVDVGSQDVFLTSADPLPVQEKLARGKRQFRNNRVEPPQLPLLVQEPKAFDVPFVDVSTTSSYSKPGDSGAKPRSRHNASVRTRGDMAFGTMTTQSQFDHEDRLTNARITYKRESLEPDLLGPLRAHRVELGDVTTTSQALDTLPSSGLGARISNMHPLRSTMRPSTEITGTAFPGWDVELYRNGQLINLQTVGDDGLYAFNNVDLFASDNNFKVVLYGPQGEVREEDVQIPVDSRRLSEMGSAYDISLTAQQTQTYRKNSTTGEDEGAPALSAIYELPVGDRSALTAGLETGQKNGESAATVHAGASTVMGGVLFNLNTAVDNNSEAGTQLVARRDFGLHQLRSETYGATDAFNAADDSSVVDVFRQRLRFDGPLPVEIGKKPRYNLNVGYTADSAGEATTDYGLGFNTRFNRIGVSQAFDYRQHTSDTEDTLNSATSISGSVAGNRVRMLANYQIKPESQLESVLVNARRKVQKNIEVEAGVERFMQQKLTEVGAKVNWDAGFAHISPGVTYNTDKDFVAMLNTRFGLARDPNAGKIRSFDRPVSSNGGVSAFVFLDKNGNNIFDGDDEPLPNVLIKAPQNSGREKTDETGYAFLRRLRPMQTTDVMVDEDTLQDPFWVSNFKGVSIVPREGHVTSLNFPIHMAGEMDGTVLARDADGNSHSFRNVALGLYSFDGRKIMSAVSEADGFYLFSKIPPGSYYLIVDEDSLLDGVSRPLPQKIEIGYGGDTIYANNIYLQDGKPDVPLSLLADASVYGESAELPAGRNFVMNLGTYKSRLSMGLAWLKLRAIDKNIFSDVDLLQKPSESVPVDEKGNYVLRGVLRENDLDQARRKCALIVSNNGFCSVEVLPGGLTQRIASK